MAAFLTVIHVLTCIFLVISILLQSSKGGGLAGMYGGGGGMGGVFGGRGAAFFLSKVTMWLGVAFAVTSITIGLVSSRASGRQRSLVEQMSGQQQQQLSTPATVLPTIPGAGDTGRPPAAPSEAQEAK